MNNLGLKNQRPKVVLGNKTNLISTLGRKTTPLAESFKQAQIQRNPISTFIVNNGNSNDVYKEPIGIHKHKEIKKKSFQIEKRKR
jgi:hypothetical protein